MLRLQCWAVSITCWVITILSACVRESGKSVQFNDDHGEHPSYTSETISSQEQAPFRGTSSNMHLPRDRLCTRGSITSCVPLQHSQRRQGQRRRTYASLSGISMRRLRLRPCRSVRSISRQWRAQALGCGSTSCLCVESPGSGKQRNGVGSPWRRVCSGISGVTESF